MANIVDTQWQTIKEATSEMPFLQSLIITGDTFNVFLFLSADGAIHVLQIDGPGIGEHTQWQVERIPGNPGYLALSLPEQGGDGG